MLPEVQTIPTKDFTISRFLGLNQKDTSNDEMFKDMLNMTSDEYPYLYPREKSAIRNIADEVDYIVLGSCIVGEDIYTVHATQGETNTVGFYKNFELVENVVLDAQDLSERNLIIFGAYIAVFPDNVMYNTQDESVKNLSYEKNFDFNFHPFIYLTDINGVPFISHEHLTIEVNDNLVSDGLTNIIYQKGHVNQNIKNADSEVEKYITQDDGVIPEVVGRNFKKRTANYDDNTTKELVDANIIVNNKGNLSVISDDTTYRLYYLSRNSKDGSYSIEQYLSQSSAYLPVDLYLTIYFETTTAIADELEAAIKSGDYIEIDSLNSEGKQIEENDVKDSYYKLISKLKNKVKVEKILRKQNHSNESIGIVIKADGFDFMQVLQDSGQGKIVYKSQTDHSSNTNKNSVYYIVGDLAVGSLSGVLKSINIKKTVPEMDYLTVSNNRIWGCSSDNHEIYSCKQGDASAWYNYSGLASDSYAVTIPNGDIFTGAVTYNDIPYFFTERNVYSIMGNKPKNFQVQNFDVRGIEDGAYKTIAQKDGYVYYKSKSGIERFNGNNSQLLTEYLNLEGLNGYYGEMNNDKYFVFLGQSIDDAQLYVYDVKKRLWHKDRQIKPSDMFELDNNLYILNINNGNLDLVKLYGKSKEVADILTENEVTYDNPEWFIESGELNAGELLNKYITKCMFELKADEGASLSISFMYDDSGEWEEVFRTLKRHEKKLIKVPIRVRRCERLRYKISGKGMSKVYSLVLTYEGGSEVG